METNHTRRSFLRGLLTGAVAAVAAPYVPKVTYSFLGGVLRPRPELVTEVPYGWSLVVDGKVVGRYRYGYNARPYQHVGAPGAVNLRVDTPYGPLELARLRVFDGDAVRVENHDIQDTCCFTTYVEARDAWSWGREAIVPPTDEGRPFIIPTMPSFRKPLC